MDFIELPKQPEGKTLEFKRALSSPDGALKTVVAFANTAGGTVLVGVDDASGHVRGVAEPFDAEERLANLITDGIALRLVPGIELLPWRRTQVLAVQVHPSPSRPYYLKREGADAGVNLRVGSANRGADLRINLGAARIRAAGAQASRLTSTRPSGPMVAGRMRREHIGEQPQRTVIVMLAKVFSAVGRSPPQGPPRSSAVYEPALV